MKTVHKTALVVCLATALGATAIAPAFSQGPGSNRGPGEGFQRIEDGGARAFRPHGGQHMGDAGILAHLIGARSAESIDVAVVRLIHRLDLSDEQAALLETLKTRALEAQTGLADARQAIRPVEEEDADRPDLTARYAGMVAMTTARTDALAALQPAFDAFVASLTDEQLARIEPVRDRDGHFGRTVRPKG